MTVKTEDVINAIAEVAENTPMMSMRPDIERIEGVKKVDFAMEPIPCFTVSLDQGERLAIVNRKYATPDEGDRVAGDYVIGRH